MLRANKFMINCVIVLVRTPYVCVCVWQLFWAISRPRLQGRDLQKFAAFSNPVLRFSSFCVIKCRLQNNSRHFHNINSRICFTVAVFCFATLKLRQLTTSRVQHKGNKSTVAFPLFCSLFRCRCQNRQKKKTVISIVRGYSPVLLQQRQLNRK
jgi:hypothetical protein